MFLQCLTRISNMLKITLVIYFKESNGNMFLFRDFRHLNRYNTNVKYLMMTRMGKLCATDNLDAMVLCNIPFIEPVTVPLDNNWLHGLRTLCEFDFHNFDFTISNHGQLLQHSKMLHSIWNKRVLLVTFCSYKRLYAKNTKTSMFSGANIFFNVVGIIAEENFKLSHESDIDHVICIYGNKIFCKLLPNVQLCVIKSLITPENLDQIKDLNYQQLPHLTRDEINNLKEQARAKKKVKKADLIEKICVCDICSKSDYDDNMSKAGPEQLDKVELHISSILEILNLDSIQNLEIVEQLCELSVASFDIESMTIDTDHLQADEHFPLDEIEHRGTEAFVQKVQKPIMISHCDSLSIAHNIDLTFTALSDKEEDIFKMMVDYWEAVCHQKELAMHAKRLIVAPLLQQVDDYRKIFFNLCGGILEGNEGEMKQGNWVTAWKATIFGKLDCSLQKLVDKYVVFSFYG